MAATSLTDEYDTVTSNTSDVKVVMTSAAWKVWLVWAVDGGPAHVAEILPPDLDRLEVTAKLGGTQQFDFDANRPGVRRAHYSSSFRADRWWRWRRPMRNERGVSLIVRGGTADAALARFREVLSQGAR